ncbi:MAG: hypothetical protein PHE61_03955 [Candidatus Omnitrophica bacterium]|nr:hypothetical protein [Candidatus Omnitrophota bacterium]
MLLNSVRILNFDDSVAKQKNLINRFKPAVVNLTKIGPRARIWSTERTASEIRQELKPGLRNSITFLGSGDFHHITSLLLERFDEPLVLIDFDYHPDWVITPPRLHCGSWLTESAKRKNIVKILSFGVSSYDISTFFIQSGNLDLFKEDRLEFYPYSHKPTGVFLRRVPENVSIKVDRGLFYSRIRWSELKDMDFEKLADGISSRSTVKRAYVSIDKDCLGAQDSLTNWEEGFLGLDGLLRLLGLIKQRFDIVGLDICGDYSEPKINGLLKSACASLDRPKDYSARGKSETLIDSVNEETNIRILEAILS